MWFFTGSVIAVCFFTGSVIAVWFFTGSVIGLSDLPTWLYLPVLVQKSAGSTEARPYFAKYGHRVSRKYGNRDMNDGSLLPAKHDRRPLMGSYHSLTFAYFKSFPGLKYMAGPDWSKQFVKPMNIDFASKLYRS